MAVIYDNQDLLYVWYVQPGVTGVRVFKQAIGVTVFKSNNDNIKSCYRFVRCVLPLHT